MNTYNKQGEKPQEHDSLLPLGIIVGLITLASIVATFSGTHTHEGSAFHHFMRMFMAGFFIVFAGFKLLDLKGFVQGYSMYDLLAKRWRNYGYIYPFIELGLGLAYLADFMPGYANAATLIVMAFNAVGARIALQKDKNIRCACLGTILKLPLTYITVTESAAMAGMAALMLIGL